MLLARLLPLTFLAAARGAEPPIAGGAPATIAGGSLANNAGGAPVDNRTPTGAPRVRLSPYEAVVPPAARPVAVRNDHFSQGPVARNDSYRPQSRRLREGDALADAIYNMRSRLDDDAPRGDAASQKLSEAVGLLRSRMDVEARRTAADLATLEAALRLFGPRPGNDALTAARDAAQASQPV